MQKAYSNNLLEIACFNVESCTIAQNSGANRIELCSNYAQGGLTPTHDTIAKARALLEIPLHVIIRPHATSFVYTDSEINHMKQSIDLCWDKMVDGVVFGCLNADNTVAIKQNEYLLNASGAMNTTFHRAIDTCVDLEKNVETIIDLGFKNILTSGRSKQAVDGLDVIKKLQDKFSDRINIIVGGGVRSGNLNSIKEFTNCNQFHSAAITDNSEMCNAEEVELLSDLLSNE